MKKTFFSLLLAVIALNTTAQEPAIEWQNTIGGNNDDELYTLKETADGGYILGGQSTSGISGDKTEGLRGLSDCWVIKLDDAGNIVWQNTLGGNGNDGLRSIQQTADGGYIVGGVSNSGISGDKTEASQGLYDYWVMKLDAGGNNIIWQNTIGGSGDEILYCLEQTADGGYILGGYSESGISGDKTEASQGSFDYWVIKLDIAGNIVWQNTIGGSNEDYLRSIQQTTDGGYILGGYSKSGISGDKIEASQGVDDYWVIKLDTAGAIVWQNTIGGNSTDYLYSLQQTTDGGYVLGGWSFSDISGDRTEASQGYENYWIIKLDGAGNIVWQNSIGGYGADYLYSIQQTADGGYILGGHSIAGISGDKTEASHGGSDLWIIKLDAAGIIIWQNTIGGGGDDWLYSIRQNADGDYIIGGSTGSGMSGDKTEPSQGGYDYWIIKLRNPYGIAQGNAHGDISGNCNLDTSDISLPGFLVKAEPGQTYGMSDDNGNYTVYLFDTGSYTISIATEYTLWQPVCTTAYNIQLSGTSDTISGIDFAMRAAYYCSRLTVELGTPRLRRCSDNSYTLQYVNSGTLPASNAYIEVDFGENLEPQSSTLPWSSVSGNIYTFQLGNININQRGSFNVTAYLDCAAQLNSTQCVTAHIYPDSVCGAPAIGWDKSETKVSGTCVNDSLVCFKIKNRSSPPSGNMQGTAPWRLFVNDTLVTQGSYQLAGQDSMIQCYPANGKTYRLEADQRLGHPGNSHPQAIVEACGSPSNFGFVNTVAQDDADLFVETFCMQVIGSFDPNDKQVFPTGITANKYIKPDSELEYLIRFQNTGNDTAFKVVIRDTIQTDVIDIATLTSGASSHDYTFNIYGRGIAEWTFDNVLLPDSNVNEPESHGFVKFKAKLLPNITPGTIVTNSADIYFDFNAPVITNEVWNTIFDTVLRALVTISGAILTESNTPVPGVTVKLAGSATDSTVTATDGAYQFEVEPGGTYTVTPLKNNDAVPSKGLTTYDILTMRRHLLGIGALPSPYKIIAASEVNAAADTSVTTQDIVLIRSLILGNTTSFPGSRLWQFVSSDYLFSDTQHPFPFNKTRTYTNLITPQLNQNFIGIKLGDVNGSWEE